MKTEESVSGQVGRIFLLAVSMVFVVMVAFVGNGAEAAAQNERLVGTIEGGPFTGAVLDDGGSSGQTFYRLNEALPDGSKIVKVFSDHVLLRSSDGGETELYTTAGSGGPVSASRPNAPPPRRLDANDGTPAGGSIGGFRTAPSRPPRQSSVNGDVDDVSRAVRGRPNGLGGRDSDEWKARRKEFLERRGRSGHPSGGK